MAGASLSGSTRQLQQLQKRLDVAKSDGFKARLLKQLSVEALVQVATSFDTEKDPYDTRWKALQHPSARRMGGKILSDTARLRNSFRASSNAQTFTVRSNVVYAAIHNYGGTVHRQGGTRLVISRDRTSGRFLKGAKGVRRTFSAGSSTIPARPFLPRQGRLGTRWTKSFTYVATTMFARQLGKAVGR